MEIKIQPEVHETHDNSNDPVMFIMNIKKL